MIMVGICRVAAFKIKNQHSSSNCYISQYPMQQPLSKVNMMKGWAIYYLEFFKIVRKMLRSILFTSRHKLSGAKSHYMLSCCL